MAPSPDGAGSLKVRLDRTEDLAHSVRFEDLSDPPGERCFVELASDRVESLGDPDHLIVRLRAGSDDPEAGDLLCDRVGEDGDRVLFAISKPPEGV